MTNDTNAQLRQMCYRLRRQGMLELDAWLEPLVNELMYGDPALAMAAKELLPLEPPQLLAMMQGEHPLPDALAPWLGLRAS